MFELENFLLVTKLKAWFQIIFNFSLHCNAIEFNVLDEHFETSLLMLRIIIF